jgi:hypothetical protein
MSDENNDRAQRDEREQTDSRPDSRAAGSDEQSPEEATAIDRNEQSESADVEGGGGESGPPRGGARGDDAEDDPMHPDNDPEPRDSSEQRPPSNENRRESGDPANVPEGTVDRDGIESPRDSDTPDGERTDNDTMERETVGTAEDAREFERDRRRRDEQEPRQTPAAREHERRRQQAAEGEQRRERRGDESQERSEDAPRGTRAEEAPEDIEISDDPMSVAERIMKGTEFSDQYVLESEHGNLLFDVHPLDRITRWDHMQHLPAGMFGDMTGQNPGTQAMQSQLVPDGSAVTHMQELIIKSLSHPTLADIEIEQIVEQMPDPVMFQTAFEIIQISAEVGDVTGFRRKP